ncbi:helix-turn-helix transcriptional regulator [Ruegeria halocynthiae]|nr:helix-turn-helix transcriptional regulator [Ruegeria halocynthiae]
MNSDIQPKIVFPSFFRAQFRSQFGKLLKDDLPELADLQSELVLDELLYAFDVADRKIGEHWPLLATNLWHYGTHQLLTAYLETSVDIATAFRDVLSKETAYLPVFAATFEPVAEGLVLKVRPAIEITNRHWDIFITLLILGETAFYKRHLPEEAKLIRYKTSLPKQGFSDTLLKIAGTKIEFGCHPEEAYTLYPYSLVGQSVGYRNDQLNKVLLEEIHRTARLPAATDQTLLRLRKLVSDSFPKIHSVDQAAAILGLSRSSMLRRLSEQGQSYRKVVQEARIEFVLVRLSNMDYGEHMEEELGFTSMRALSAFCRKNTGYTLKKLAKKSD